MKAMFRSIAILLAIHLGPSHAVAQGTAPPVAASGGGDAVAQGTAPPVATSLGGDAVTRGTAPPVAASGGGDAAPFAVPNSAAATGPAAAPMGDECAPNAQTVGPGGKTASAGSGDADDGAPCASFWVRDRGWSRQRPDRPGVSLGEYVIVQTDQPLPTLLANQRNDRQLGLYINDLFFKDIKPMPVPHRPRAAMFHLVRSEDNRSLWSVLFTRKGLGGNARNTCDNDPHDGIYLSVGYGNGESVAPQNSACLEYFPHPWGATALAALCIAFILFTLWKARTTSMIRDVGIPPPGKLGPYSLARFQMALWFVTVICAILFCYAVTGDLSPIPQGTLILMGIGAGTAVGAGAIDVSAAPGSFTDYRQQRRVYAQSHVRLRQLSLAAASQDSALKAAQAANDPAASTRLGNDLRSAQASAEKLRRVAAVYEAPASKGFLVDILSDGNGIAFHRVQVLIWTMVYWIIFIVTLVHTISLTDFDPTALALMGLSGATYLGFKLQQPAKTGENTRG